MTRTAAVLGLACGLVFAAPVPKVNSPKLEDVFGEIADKKSECKFEMNKTGALTVTVPTTHPPAEPSPGVTCKPLASKEVDGDFTVTLKMTFALPNEAKAVGKAAAPAVVAGVSFTSVENAERGFTVGFVRRPQKKEWEWAGLMLWTDGAAESVFAYEGVPKYIRVSRQGEKVELETSRDGKRWDSLATDNRHTVTGPVKIGPTAFGCIDKEFSVTFDEYKVESLKEEKK